MLIEVRVKVAYIVDEKCRKKVETFLLDKEFFAQAEYAVTEYLNAAMASHAVQEFEIQSLKMSSVKEIDDQSYNGELPSFMATLRDYFHDDDGNEKQIKYKVLMWAESLSDANARALELSHQGYDMLVEGIKQVDYIYLIQEESE